MSSNQNSPGVVSRVGDHLFAVGIDRHGKLDGLAVLLLVIIGFRNDLPVLAAIQVFDDAYLHWLFLLVADFVLERFRRRALAHLHDVIHTATFAREIEGI